MIADADANSSFDFEKVGPHSVVTQKVEWPDMSRQRTVPVKIFAPKGEGKWPVVIFSHGLGGSRDGYGYLGRHWASHGFTSIHVQHEGSDSAVWEGHPVSQRVDRLKRAAFIPKNSVNRPKDISFVIDELTRLQAEKSTTLPALDLDRIGVAGHSFGAFTALAVAGQIFTPGREEISFRDPRVKAIIAMSSTVPRDSSSWQRAFGEIRIPCFHMTGTLDESPVGGTQPEDRRVPFDFIHAPNQFLVNFVGGDHFIFSGRWREQTGGEQDEKFQLLIKASSTAYWRAFLLDDSGADEWLEKKFPSILGAAGEFEMK